MNRFTLTILTLLLSFCAMAQMKLAEPVSDSVSKVSLRAEYGKVLLNHDRDKIFFVKSHDYSVVNEEVSQTIWQADWKGIESLENGAPIGAINNNQNNGVVGICKNGQRLYLLGTYSKKKRLWPGISVSEKTSSGWSEPFAIPVDNLNIRSELFDFYVTPDEKAMFIVMGKSQYGQMDIYVSELKMGRFWSTPVLLDSICTDSTQEISPFYSPEYEALFFASDRKDGLGGFDIYESKKGRTWLDWETPTPLPEPYNSDQFDAYFTAYEGEGAFLMSNRTDDMGKLFFFDEFGLTPKDEDKPMELTIDEFAASAITLMSEEDTELNFAKFMVDYDGDLPEEAEAYAKNRGDLAMDTAKIERDGSFIFKNLSYGEEYELFFSENMDTSKLTVYNSSGNLNKTMVMDDQGYILLSPIDIYPDEDDTDASNASYKPQTPLQEFQAAAITLMTEEDTELDFAKFSVEYEGELPEDAEAYVKDNKDKLLETAEIEKDGTFILRTLEYDKGYSLSFSENIDVTVLVVYNVNEGAKKKMYINDENCISVRPTMIYPDTELDFGRFKEVELETEPTTQRELTIEEFSASAITMMNVEDTDLDFAKFMVEYDGDLPDDAQAYVTDENDQLTETAKIYKDGSFVLKNLNYGEGYKMSFSESVDNSKLSVYSTSGGSRKKMNISDDGFIAVRPVMVYPDTELDFNRFGADGTEEVTKPRTPIEEFQASTITLMTEEDTQLEFAQFSVVYDGDLPESAEAYVKDTKDKVTETAKIDEDGTFILRTLDYDEGYTVSFSQNVDVTVLVVYNVNGSDKKKMYINDEGCILVRPMMIYPDTELDFSRFDETTVETAAERELTIEEFAASAITMMSEEDTELDFARFMVEYDGDLPENAEAVVRDGNNQITETAKIEKDGSFVLKNLEYGEGYQMSFSENVDNSKLTVYSTDGTNKKKMTISDKGFVAVRPMMVYPDSELDFGRFALDGSEEVGKPKTPIEEFQAASITMMGEEDAELDFAQFSVEYDGDLPDNAEAYVTDRNDKLTETAKIEKDGSFVLKNLNYGEGYQMSFSDNIDDSKLSVYNTNGDSKKRMYMDDDGFVAVRPVMIYPDSELDFDRFAENYVDEDVEVEPSTKTELTLEEFAAATITLMSEEDTELDFAKFTVDYDGDLPDNAEAYLNDENNQLTETAKIEKDGSFVLKNLEYGEGYQISFSENIDKSKLTVYSTDGVNKKKMTINDDGFVTVRPIMVYPDTELDFNRFASDGTEETSKPKTPIEEFQAAAITLMTEEDSELDFAQFVIEYDGELPDNAEAYITDQNDKLTETAKIEKDGSFKLNNLDYGEGYQMSFSENMDDSKVTVYNSNGDSKKKMYMNDDGFVALRPVMIYSDSELDFGRFADGGQDNTAKKEAVKPAKPARVPGSQKAVIETVNFDFNKIIPDGENTIKIDRAVIDDKTRLLELTGHSDIIGTEDINQKISEQRAEEVKKYLVRNGYSEDLIETKGYGTSQPISDIDTEEGRAQNRRVEIRLK